MPQDKPIIQDEYAPAINNQRDVQYYGPVYIDQYWADSQGSYFLVREEDRDKLPERAMGARVAPHEPQITTLMTSAFHAGKPVSVWPTNRWWIGQDKFVWTIGAAKLGF